ncbi:MAG: UDP-3-O-acyl-N-acetylglucosamine deacetylase [Pirellulaceae bacterium]
MRHTLRQQRTIAHTADVLGFGYWSSQDVRVQFRPAAENTGIVFVRDDLSPARRIPANIENRIETPRRTTLAADGAVVEMVEHIMAALWGLSIDNCEVHVDACEMPGCDGSSQAYVDALRGAEIVEQDALRRQLIVTDTTRVGGDDAWVSASPARDGLHIKYRLDYGNHTPIGRQTINLTVTPESFVAELARARTFVLRQEAEWLREQGLGVRATYQDLLVFGEEGPLDNELRFQDECVRHKTLDLVGDLALAGCPVVGQITAHRSGHRLNAELVRALLSEGQILEPLRKSA